MNVVVKSGKLSRQTLESAGWDVYANGEHTLAPGESKLIPTGLVTEMRGCWGKLFDRSSMAIRGLTTRAGVIDADYDKEWKVVMVYEPGAKSLFQRIKDWFNGTVEPSVVIKDGERIAQVVFFPTNYVSVDVTGFGTVERKCDERKGGFGSTGK
jgi:deoxyuridine 5'-triphosphate nucleotidohydrolase